MELILSPQDQWIFDKYIVYFDDSNGYWRMKKSAGEKYDYVHRWLMDATKGDIVDHVNRNKCDCRRENLRLVDKSLNNYNRKVKSKYGRGIYFDKHGNRYRAYISHNNKSLKLGSFKTVEDAKAKYNEKAKEIYGKNAILHEL